MFIEGGNLPQIHFESAAEKLLAAQTLVLQLQQKDSPDERLKQSSPLWDWFKDVWKTDRGRLLCLHTPSPPSPPSLLRCGGRRRYWGSPPRQQTHIQRGAHALRHAPCGEYNGGGALRTALFCRRETPGASCRGRAHRARGHIWASSRENKVLYSVTGIFHHGKLSFHGTLEDAGLDFFIYFFVGSRVIAHKKR